MRRRLAGVPEEGLCVRNNYREHVLYGRNATIPAKTEDVRVRAVQECATHGNFPALRASEGEKRIRAAPTTRMFTC
jgi:hypothetical protein